MIGSVSQPVAASVRQRALFIDHLARDGQHMADEIDSLGLADLVDHGRFADDIKQMGGATLAAVAMLQPRAGSLSMRRAAGWPSTERKVSHATKAGAHQSVPGRSGKCRFIGTKHQLAPWIVPVVTNL